MTQNAIYKPIMHLFVVTGHNVAKKEKNELQLSSDNSILGTMVVEIDSLYVAGGGTLKLTNESVELTIKKFELEVSGLLVDIDSLAFIMADYIYVLDQGRVIAKGKPKKIQNNKKVLEAYLGD